MSNLLAFQPMHAVIDVSTTVEMKVALSDLGVEIGDILKIRLGHVRRGIAKISPAGSSNLVPATYADYALSKANIIAAPSIDGHIATGEWSKATEFVFVLESDQSATAVRGYVMHDANYLYIAITGQIPHNGFVSANIFKAGAFTPDKLTAPTVAAGGGEYWDTLVEGATPGTFDTDYTRADGSDLIESALGFANMGTRKVFIQLIGANGKALRARGALLAYLSDDAHGNSVVTTEPDGAVAVGTDGVLIPILTGALGAELAKTVFRMVSESDGDIDISIINATTDTFYLVLVLPNGRLVVSDAIEFST